jgi:hypothetical protein
MEVCDERDNNCNGQTDEGVLLTFYQDADSDTYGNVLQTTQACTSPSGHVTDNTDCNDASAASHPGATEICDGSDNDCDGAVDESPTNPLTPLSQACYTGASGTENVSLCHGGTQTCTGGTLSSCVGEILPTAEVCDGQDNDCNGVVDEGNPGSGASCSTGLPGVCSAGTQTCTTGALVCQQTTQPGVEVCGNGIDDDCDGSDLACPPPPPPSVDVCTPTNVLDNFNRADGSIGANWRGATGTSFYRIAGIAWMYKPVDRSTGIPRPSGRVRRLL